MAHTHEKLVMLLFGWRHAENGNYRWQHASSFYCGKHTNQLSPNTTTYYYTRKFLQTMHKIWLKIPKLYYTPHISNCLEITKRGNTRLRLNANKWRNKDFFCKIRLIPAIDRLRSYSINYWTEISTMVVIQSVSVDSISMIMQPVRFYWISARNNCFLIINSSTNHGKNITQWIRGAFIPRSTKRLTYRIMWDRIHQNGIIFWWTRWYPWSTKKYCKIRANVTAKIKEQYLGKCASWQQLWGLQLC